MRISDWSSDVCSSDLAPYWPMARRMGGVFFRRTRTDDLIARPQQEPDWRAPDMHEAREGRDDEEGQAQHNVQLVDQCNILDRGGRRRIECQHYLRPAHEAEHLAAVHMLDGPPGGQDTKNKW